MILRNHDGTNFKIKNTRNHRVHEMVTYLVGQNDLSGRLNRPLIGRRTILDMFNFSVKTPTDLLIGRPL